MKNFFRNLFPILVGQPQLQLHGGLTTISNLNTNNDNIMMFGGSVASMNTSLKNNKRPNQTIFDDAKSPKSKTKYLAKHKKKTKEEILEIEQKVQRIKKIERIKLIVATIVIVSSTIGIWAWLS